MDAAQVVGRVRKLLVVLGAIVAGVVVPPSTASAASCQAWGAQPANAPGRITHLVGVSVVSKCLTWAAGASNTNGTDPTTLVERWNGTAWKILPSPSPGNSEFTGVAATSPGNAWAVGQTVDAGFIHVLIEHWNGTSWALQQAPNPGDTANGLVAVDASSATNAWAVGDSIDAGDGIGLALHCC